MSSAPSTAWHTVCPIRPAARETATLITPRRRAPGYDGLDCRAEGGLVAADAGPPTALGLPQLASERVHVVQGDRVERREHLVHREQRHVHQDRAAQPVHAGEG